MSNTERCEFCQYSAYRNEESMFCVIDAETFHRLMIVLPHDSCKKFVREPGADDEVAA